MAFLLALILVVSASFNVLLAYTGEDISADPEKINQESALQVYSGNSTDEAQDNNDQTVGNPAADDNGENNNRDDGGSAGDGSTDTDDKSNTENNNTGNDTENTENNNSGSDTENTGNGTGEDSTGEDGTGGKEPDDGGQEDDEKSEDESGEQTGDEPGEDIPLEETEELEELEESEETEESEKEIPPFEMMDLDTYGSMKNMLYTYALTYAEEGSLQEQINDAAEAGESECTLDLSGDVTENLVILDEIKVTLNLNGNTLYPSERIYSGSMSVITVFGELVLDGEGSIAPGEMEDVRGITVSDGGHLTVNGGTITGFDVEGNGAGILVENKGTCEINGGQFTGNRAAYYGGSLFANDAGSVTLNGGIWENNHAANGGGIALNQASGESCVWGNIVVKNNEADEKGGGIYVENAIKGLTLENTTVEGNTAKTGGGMYFANGADISLPENGNVAVGNNHATAGSGGGIWLNAGSAFTMAAGNKITGNIADGVNGAEGGGIYLYRGSTFTMTGGEISGNNALTNGGGIALISGNNYCSSFFMSGGAVKENSVGRDDVVQTALYGGGIYVGEYSEEVRISGDAVIANNSGASYGGGIYIAGKGKGFFLDGGEISENRAASNHLSTYGGGIYCNTSTVMTMTGGIIHDNHANNDGGGVYAGTVTMTGGEIYSNSCGTNGGGVRAGSFTMNGGAIHDNVLSNGYGGGIYAPMLVMNEGSKIYNNTAAYGGGIYAGTLVMNEGSEVYGNTGYYDGGGMYVIRINGIGSGATIDGGKIYHNSAGRSGGAVCLQQPFNLNGGEIYENTAANGGGIYTNWYSHKMTGGTIRNNMANGAGGGICCYGGALEMTEGAIQNNTAQNGGGISGLGAYFEITGGEISGNESTDGNGGGIRACGDVNNWNNHEGKRLKISGTAKIVGNTAKNNGGGIFVTYGSAVISGGEIFGNTALGAGNSTGYGGGVYVDSTVTNFELTGGILKDNTAKRQGQDFYGISAYNAGRARMRFEICAVRNMDGAKEDSRWLDEQADDYLKGAVDNLQDAEKLEEEDKSGTGKRSIKYAYTFCDLYEEPEYIAQVDEDFYESVQAAVDAVKASGASDKTIRLLSDHRETVLIPEGVIVTLDLNGHALKGELTSVIEVQENADLTIRDSSKKGTGQIREGKGKTVEGSKNKTETYGGGLYVAGKATLISGAIINNTANLGAGVYISKHGEFTMEGGRIADNNIGRGVQVYYYYEAGTAGVAARFTLKDGLISGNAAGGVSSNNNNVAGAEIVMEGGEISKHTQNNNGNGAGISITGETLTISGGVIRENKAGAGGGIYGYGNRSRIIITGGTIENNSAVYGGGIFLRAGSKCEINKEENSRVVISGNKATSGGGIFADSNAVLTMNAGEIRENSASNGGGVYAAGSVFTMNAGEIQENTATTGGGLYVQNTAKIIIDGDALLTGNKASDTAGGIYYGTATGDPNRWFEMSGGAVYGNETDHHPSDLYIAKNSYVKGLLEIDQMDTGEEEYTCWFDYISYKPQTADEIMSSPDTGYTPVIYDLAVSGDMTEEGSVCRIQANGKVYSSIAAAVADIRAMTAEEKEGVVIELLKDHTESVKIPNGLVFTVDLGGYTLEPERSDYTFYMGSGVNLTVQNGTLSGEGREVSRGIRLVGGTNAADESTVAILNMNHVTLKDFSGNAYGGGIYATGYWGITLDEVTIENCSATERGGGIYADRPGQRYDYDFIMKNSTVTGCEAKECGGGVYVYVSGTQDASLYRTREIIFENCRITDNKIDGNYGGGMYIGTSSIGNDVKLSVSESTICGNEAKAGGGLYLTKIRSLDVHDVEILQNRTTGGAGGGLYVVGNNTVNLEKINAYDNKTTGGAGGGLYTSENKIVNLENIDVHDNETNGGGCAGLYCLNDSEIHLEKVNVHDNTAAGGNAAGASITCNSTNPIVIKNSKFNNNSVVSVNGTGGLLLSGAAEISDSEICGNSAASAGGVYIAEKRWGNYPVTFTNVQIKDNYARTSYGGVYMWQSGNRKYTFDQCEISGNTCSNGWGGGIGASTISSCEIDFIDTVISENSCSGVGGGICIYEGGNDVKLNLQEGTVIEKNRAGGSGGGIYIAASYQFMHTLTIQEGTSIRDNTAAGTGGGICAIMGNIELAGGEVIHNTGNYGGGIAIGGRAYHSDWKCGFFKMTGGRIAGNTARTDGGGLYVSSYCDDGIEISGGEITGNHAAGKGGGIGQSSTNAHFQLLPGGKIYDNEASLGQDVYGNYENNKVSHLNLAAAEDMFDEDDASHKGIGWLDEKTNEIITTDIRGKLVRYYALTLLYDNGETVAMIGDQSYTSVQKAVDALQRGDVTVDEGQIPEIIMVKDSVENVVIPGEMALTLNLNGRTLRGHSTAISCQGNLTIVDQKEEGAAEESVGTITGFAVEAGGGIHVLAGGNVTMKGGQIANCYGSTAYTSDNTGTKGGAAVCVDAGVFVLEGGSLNHNNASCGSAVLVRNKAGKFRMLGGTIEENTGNYGTVDIHAGTAEIAGGRIINNMVARDGGGIYLNAGALNIIGNKENKVEISGNKATERGGGIFINNGSASLKNVEIMNNATTGAKRAGITAKDLGYSAGGGIYANIGRLDIGVGVSIMNNDAVRGGGIYQGGAGTIHMIDGVISKNTARMGGGVAQYPNAVCKFLLMGGGVYDNISKLSSAGNDFYSRYEGTDANYGKNSVVPQLTLINAASMGNKNYNAWKDDAYIVSKGEEGYQRLGEKIGEGQYIIADITMSYNVDLTASHYETEEVKTSLLTDLEVGGIILEQSTINGPVKVVTGEKIWDNDTNTAAVEKTAEEMLGFENWEESDLSYGDGLHYIRYTGSEEKYAKDHGNGAGLYERHQMVDWVPGNDSEAGNTLVRTFDKVTYPFTITMQKSKVAPPPDLPGNKGEDDTEQPEGEEVSPEGSVQEEASDITSNDVTAGGSEKPEDVPEDAYYRLWLEVRLPADAEEADFVTGGKDAFSTMKHYVMETQLDEQGNSVRVMRGYWELKGSEFVQGGTRGDSVTIKIYGMCDGDTLKPEFTCWMEGSEEVTKSCQSSRLTVSAAAKYNVAIDYNSDLSYTSYFDMESGLEASEKEMAENPAVKYGTMLGYGVTVELYNDNKDKGLKGIELPADGIEFDLRFKGGLYMDGEPVIDSDTGKPAVAAPYIWAYKENETGDFGKALGETAYIRNMNWNDEDDTTKTTNYAYNAAPYNNGGGSNGCYNGGTWTMESGTPDPDITETVVHARVSGYSIDYTDNNPVAAANGSRSGEAAGALQNSYVKAFSAGYIQLVFPIDESKAAKDGYLSIAMEAAVTGTEAESISGNAAVSGSAEGDKDRLKKYFGVDPLNDLKEGLAKGETVYRDNYSGNEFGTYVIHGDGTDDLIIKTNYFLTAGEGPLSGSEGNASTPLMSVVYIGGDVLFISKSIRTDDEWDKEHYIKPEDFNTQTDNKVEYNYLTAMNILQKFDADAYTPIDSGIPVINKDYGFDSKGIGNFKITTSETAAAWSSAKTRKCKLSILYAAKPDGTNWAKKPVEIENGDADKVYDDGGVADMDSCREENLIYFESMQDLKDYFAAKGTEGKCVAILYELRDCSIRSGRSVQARAGMQVSNDFGLTGNTYCTTNDVRIWTNYRPVYKDYYKKYYNSASAEEKAKFEELIYTYTWEQVSHTENGVKAYGRGLEEKAYHGSITGAAVDKEDEGYRAYFEYGKQVPAGTEKATTLRPHYTGSYENGYIKSQYVGGLKKAGTHNGWRAGNTLLINTLEPKISVYNGDFIEGSGGASGKARKTSYDVSNGERKARFELEPTLFIADGLEDHGLVSTGSLSTGVSIEITLPKKLDYQEGSILFDYSDKNCGYREGELEWAINAKENADGTTTLSLYTDVTDIRKKLPEIFFETFIGSISLDASTEEEVENGEILRVKASITPIYGKENQMAAKSSFGERSIKIVKNSDNAAYIVTQTPLLEIGEDLIYDMYYRSRLDVTDVELVNVLPYNGDGRDSSFSGGYRLSGIEITFNNKEDYEQYLKDGKIGFKEEQEVPGRNMKDREEALKYMRDNKELFEVLTQDNEKLTVTYRIPDDPRLVQTDETDSGIGLYVGIPQVKQNCGFVVKTVLSPRDSGGDPITGKDNGLQNGDNLYGDSFFYKSGVGNTETVPTSNAYIRLIGRYISGIVWMDQDNDGKYVAGNAKNPSNDRVMAGVDVTLRKVNESGQMETARDIFGEEVTPVRTDKDGRYRFENLAAGEYQVVFTNEASNDRVSDAADYHIKKGTEDVTPISFNRLSLTRLDGSAAVRSSNYNYAVPDYGTNQDTDEGPAALEAAHLYQNIVLPEAEAIRATPYVSGNWNAGLYYIDQGMEKNWKNMTKYDADKEYGVTFEVKGTYKADADESEEKYFIWNYKMSGNGNKGKDAVKAEGPFLDEQRHTFTATAAPALGDKAEVQTYTWKLESLALQAEGRSGKITYTVDETDAFELQKKLLTTQQLALEGFIRETESTGDQTAVRQFTANNTQVLYEIDVTKIGEQIDVTDIDSGLAIWNDEVRPVEQSGAAFGIYSDKECKTLLKEVSAVNAVSGFTSLPGGTYYVKETKAPLFYALSEAVFELMIAYPNAGDAETGAIPQVRLTNLSGSGDVPVITVRSAESGKSLEELERPEKNYQIGFDIEDELITGEVLIHKTDGNGKDLDGVAFRLERQDERQEAVEGVTAGGGKLEFKDLKPGTYILTEVSTENSDPENRHTLLAEPVTVTLPCKVPAGDIENTDTDARGKDVVYDGKDYYFYSLTYEISNEAMLKLPQTGGSAGVLPVAAAALVLAAGGYLALRRRKKSA